MAAAAGGAALALSCVAVVWGTAPSGGRSELQSVGPAAAVAAAQAAQSQVKSLPDPTVLLIYTRTLRSCGFAPSNASSLCLCAASQPVDVQWRCGFLSFNSTTGQLLCCIRRQNPF